MEMTGKEKLYFLLDAIDDADTIAPSGQPLIIDPTNDLNRRIRDIELKQLFTKLQDDEKVLNVLQIPSSTRTVDIVEDLDPYDPPYQQDDGCWHIKLLPKFDRYYLKIQYEVEYQEFTGKKPPELLEKEIEKQRSQQAIRPTFIPTSYTNSIEVKSAKEIVNEFSIKNRAYVASVLEEILSCSDFVDDEIYYQTTTLGGQSLINERSLVKKLSSLGLYRYIGAEDIGGSIKLRDLDKKLTQEVIDLLRKVEEDHSIVVADVSTKSVAEWSDNFRWEDSKFVFGTYGSTKRFTSNVKRKLFNKLVEAKGKWVELSILRKLTDKDNAYLRVTIGQINSSWDKSLKNHVTLISTDDDNLQPKPQNGAYRIKILEKSL